MPRKRKKATVRSRAAAPRLELQESTRRQIGGIMQIVAGILLFLSLRNEAGALGERVQQAVTFLVGAWGMLLPAALVLSGVLQWLAMGSKMELKRTVGLAVCLLAFLGIMHIGPIDEIGHNRSELAGALGFMVSLPFVLWTTPIVGYTVLMATFLIGIFLAFEPDIVTMVSRLVQGEKEVLPAQRAQKADRKTAIAVEQEEDDEELEDEHEEDLVEEDIEPPELNIVRPSFANAMAKSKAQQLVDKQMKAKKAASTLEMKDTRFEEWTFPALDLLDTAQSTLTINDEQLKRQAKLIEQKLSEFEIDVAVRDARPGPTVTQFTLQPSEGVKLSKIASLKDDLALALAAQSLRIEAPIPGKSLVGIEMPNEVRTTVHMREILESSQFHQNTSALTLPLGRDVSGEAVVGSLENMPHLLIAGATGSGKSVCMNVFLSALLYQNAPHELKLILIDPKRVELMPYNGIPHLLTPVITEADKALQALRWTVAEMGRRLHRFSEQGVRNIDEFNEKQSDESLMLPRIVIVVDELADLMMRQYRRDTETMIVRISQMARATGMHLIIATQRPSVDVITGLIKANIPTRIAFRTVSAVDSRTIIDGIGAEDLLGKGDMLYMTADTQKPVRVQGIYISTEEITRIINAVKIAGGGKITEQIGLAEEEEGGGGAAENDEAGIDGPVHAQIDLEADDNGGDDLFFDAVQVVQNTGKASASLLQRQLKVGYARAARLLDIMEEKGLIGPADGAKPRKLYMSRETAASSASDI